MLGKTYDGLPLFGSCGCDRSQGYVTRTELTSERKKCPECGYMVPVDTDGVCSCSCGYTFIAKSTIEERNDALRAFVEEERVESMGGLMGASGVPKMYRDVEPDYELAERIISSGRGFYFYGGTGTFKTVKAASVARAFLDKGKSVLFVPSVELLAMFRDAMNTGKTEESVMRLLIMADLLVIDDIGKEKLTDWAVSTLYRVVDARYSAERPMVVTANYDRKVLAMKLAAHGEAETAESLVSKLMEATEAVDFGNDDNRVK